MRSSARLVWLGTCLCAFAASVNAQANRDLGGRSDSARLGDADPRIELVSLLAADRLEEALDAVEALIETPSPGLDSSGAHYLRGHILHSLRRVDDAGDAFAAVISSGSSLSEHARLRVAELQEEVGFASAAAALATEVLLLTPPRSITDRALAVLSRTLVEGGDCRLLDRLKDVRLRSGQRRQYQLLVARCDLQQKDASGQKRAEGKAKLAQLIRAEHRDLAGLLAADLLYPLLSVEDTERSVVRDLAQTFHHHRRFELSVPLQRRELPQPLTPVRTNIAFNQHYQIGRGHFWQGEFLRAAQEYLRLAERSVLADHKSRALHHRSRALELAGLWTEAKSSYVAAHNANPTGSVAGSGLLGSLRLRLRSGEEQAALENYAVLSRSSSLRRERRLAALFLASSFLENSRVKDVRQWLDDSEQRSPTAFTHYWRGRLAELEAEPEAAIEHYLEGLELDYFHPMAQHGLQRLEQPELRATALSLGQRLAREGRRLNAAWILLGSQHEAGLEASKRLEKSLLRRARQDSLAPDAAVAAENWPLWQRTSFTADELLLSYGIWSESGEAAQRLFPSSSPNLAFTAALELQRAGRTREGLAIVETLAKSIPQSTPPRLVPTSFRRALYPYAYRFLIEQAARRFRVDPLLLAALIREESRFNPRAASNAAARGLTQFIIPTAERYANEIGFDELTPDDLDKPEISIPLAAAYVKELSLLFDGRPEQILAAYNAGEAQAQLWGLHCYSNNPAEYITKIGFSETRAYVVKVLRSYAQYQDLYRESAF